MGIVELVRRWLKDFDEGRLIFQNSKSTRAVVLNNWKQHIDPNGDGTGQKGWTSVNKLNDISSAGLLDADREFFVWIEGGKEQWIR